MAQQDASFASFNEHVLGKKCCVTIRLDLNVPRQGERILDETRLNVALQTLRLLSNHRLVIFTHWGRPKAYEESSSVSFLAPILSKALQRPVAVAQSPDEVSKDNPVTLLENIRFFPGETCNDPTWSQRLAALGDVFLNEAFSASHRTHASIVGIAQFIPSFMGPSFEKEWDALKALRSRLKNGQAVALIGGSKVSTKIGVLRSLIKWCDKVMIGGGMGNTFLAMQGIDMAESFFEKDGLDMARECWEEAGGSILLPIDGVEKISHEVTPTPKNAWADIGPKTLKEWYTHISKARTVFWNGPMGMYECPPLDEGSRSLARFLDQHNKKPDVYSVAGGGDTLAVLNSAHFSYKSPSGGAFLEALESGTLPGLEALIRA